MPSMISKIALSAAALAAVNAEVATETTVTTVTDTEIKVTEAVEQVEQTEAPVAEQVEDMEVDGEESAEGEMPEMPEGEMGDMGMPEGFDMEAMMKMLMDDPELAPILEQLRADPEMAKLFGEGLEAPAVQNEIDEDGEDLSELEDDSLLKEDETTEEKPVTDAAEEPAAEESTPEKITPAAENVQTDVESMVNAAQDMASDMYVQLDQAYGSTMDSLNKTLSNSFEDFGKQYDENVNNSNKSFAEMVSSFAEFITADPVRMALTAVVLASAFGIWFMLFAMVCNVCCLKGGDVEAEAKKSEKVEEETSAEKRSKSSEKRSKSSEMRKRVVKRD